MKSFILASAFSGLLLGLSLNFPAFWFLSIIGLLPFFYFWHREVKTKKDA